MRRVLPLVVLPLLSLALTGCLEVIERWTLDDRGGGRLDLVVTYDAALLAQVKSVVGERALVGLGSHDVPLTVKAWKPMLDGAPGVEVTTLEESLETGGWHRFHLALRFESLAAVARLEPFAGRRFLLEAPPAGSEGEARRARLVMDPFRHVPLVDPWLALRRGGAAADAEARADPDRRGWRERLGLDASRADLLTDLLEARTMGVRLACEIDLPGAIVEEAGEAGHRGRSTRIVLDRAALEDTQRNRALRIVWRAGDLDIVKGVDQIGDAPRPHLLPADLERAR
ncbi:MAG: hypothetical protein AB7G65_20040 [Thermoleophilia bacterium]